MHNTKNTPIRSPKVSKDIFVGIRFWSLAAICIIAAVGVYADNVNQKYLLQNLRTHIIDQSAVVRAKLEGNITSNIQLSRGLVSTLTTEPDMSQERFGNLAKDLFSSDSQLRVVAGAPDLVVSMIYPFHKNKHVIGLDYNKHEKQRDVALKVRDTGQLLLAGPVELVQGGLGFIARFPVFTDANNTRKFWGIVSAVFDVDALYAASGLTDPSLGIDFALVGRNGTGADGELFYGSPSVLENDPVLGTVNLPQGTWQIAAVPREGWVIPPLQLWTARFLIILIGGIVFVPIYIAGRLVEARSANIRALKLREEQLESANTQIEHLALHDALTGLPNRRYLDKILSECADENADPVSAVIMMDLDRFKQINDTFGHSAGDALLKHFGQVVNGCIAKDDFVARVGGDEFVVVCREHRPDDALSDLAQCIVDAARQPFEFNGSQCRFGASVGIARNLDSSTSPKQLLANADIALYRAKKLGRNCYEFFSQELRAASVYSKRTADEILEAIEANQFVPFYQPQHDAHTHAVVGVEALARWKHPERGILTPDKFIAIAEDINVAAKIDRAILQQTLKDFERWEALGLNVPKASVNVSLQRLRESNLFTNLIDLNIRPDTISFELLESIFLDESDETTSHNIDLVRNLGIDIEIDDFGSGHTSILSLLKLKPTRLKIDRQLVIPALESDASRQLVKSVIEIGKSLNIEVLAEGVETMEHARMLESLGCDTLQGYAFGRPMAAEALEASLGISFKMTG